MVYFNEISKILNHYNIDGYLVGGCIRDYLLGREIKDIDLVVSDKAGEVAREFAHSVDGSFVVLDEFHNIYRVVVGDIIYDLSLLVGNSIEEDLFRRDFTINAMALSFSDAGHFLIQSQENDDKRGEGKKINEEGKQIIDPTGGKKDIINGIIRAVNEDVFKDDPLRLLRAIRFKSELDFTIDRKTEGLIEREVESIKNVARERIRDELIKIMSLNKAAENIVYLENRFSLLSILIPSVNEMKIIGPCKYHKEDLWTHSLHTVDIIEELLDDDLMNTLSDSHKIRDFGSLLIWSRQIKPDNIFLIKFAALFHDIGKLISRKVIDGEVHFYGHDKKGAKYIEPILYKMRFSKYEISYIKRLIRYHMRPLSLYNAENLTDKGRYRFFAVAGELTPAICLLSAADVISTRMLNNRIEEIEDYLNFIKGLVRRYMEMEDKTRKPLLSGQDVMDLLNLEKGPEVGRLLQKIKEAQAIGEIYNREEAVVYLKNIFK